MNVYYISRYSSHAWLVSGSHLEPGELYGYPLDSYSPALSVKQIHRRLITSPNSFTTELPQPPNYYVQSI